jgi:hypothetical protein
MTNTPTATPPLGGEILSAQPGSAGGSRVVVPSVGRLRRARQPSGGDAPGADLNSVSMNGGYHA